MPCHDAMYENNYSKTDLDKYHDCERELCGTRWVLLQLVDLCRETKVVIPPSLDSHILKERLAQLKHRRDDQDYAVRILIKEIEGLKRTIEEIKRLGGIPAEEILLQVENLRNSIDEIKNLKEKELLNGSWINPVTAVDMIEGRQNHA